MKKSQTAGSTSGNGQTPEGVKETNGQYRTCINLHAFYFVMSP